MMGNLSENENLGQIIYLLDWLTRIVVDQVWPFLVGI